MKTKYFICLLLLLWTFVQPVSAQTETDSLSVHHIPITSYKFQPKSLILPASLIAVGAVGTAIDGMNDFHLIHRKDSVNRIHIDDYMEWGMHQLCLVGLGEIINAGLTRGTKYLVNERRPDGGKYSFPSGHTANAFLGAHIAYKEFKDSNPWLAYSGYALGLFVAGSRIYNNRHWVADVIAGAGYGILAAELSYLIYFPIRNAIAEKINLRRDRKLLVSPVLNEQGGGLYFSYTF